MTQGQAILGVSWGTLIVGIVLVSLRIHSRASRKALSGDDYTIAVASVGCLTPTSTQDTQFIPASEFDNLQCLLYAMLARMHLRIHHK